MHAFLALKVFIALMFLAVPFLGDLGQMVILFGGLRRRWSNTISIL